MKAAVWDTYVKKKDGNVLHFDILVPEGITDEAKVFEYGAAYLKSINEPAVQLDAQQCRFCHLEELKPEWENTIRSNGYCILELDEIPAQLPKQPTRRQMILHLRAHAEDCRFADFRSKSDADLQMMLGACGITHPTEQNNTFSPQGHENAKH